MGQNPVHVHISECNFLKLIAANRKGTWMHPGHVPGNIPYSTTEMHPNAL